MGPMGEGDSKRPPWELSESPPSTRSPQPALGELRALRQSSPPPGGARPGSVRPPAIGGSGAPIGSIRPSPGARADTTLRPSGRISFPSLRLGALDYDLASAAKRVIEGALGVARGERVVLIVDRSRRDVGAALLEVARDVGADPIVHEIEPHGERPLRLLPEPIRSALRRAQASIVNIGFEDGEIGMRHELLEAVKSLSLRHAHMIGVSRKSLIAGFSVDHARILATTRAVRTRLRSDSRLRLRTAAGSDLEVQLDPAARWSEHVGVIRPGKWESLPSGKLITCPASVKGTFVADASMGGQFGQGIGLLERAPVRIELEGSMCKSVRCLDRGVQREVEAFLQREHNLLRVGGLCLGTNIGIVAPTGEVTADQNLPGLHLVFGSAAADQTGATWSTRAQLALTCAGGDVDLDGAPLLRAGRYMVT
jgi:aminopeptidase